MRKKIIDLVRDKEAAIEADPRLREPFARLAADAMNRGRSSLAWRNFMLQFVEKDPTNPQEPLDPAQLERLLAMDGTLGDPAMDRRRAYLLSNRMCGGGSTGFTGGIVPPLDFGVDTIDEAIVGGDSPTWGVITNNEPNPAPVPNPEGGSSN